MENKQSEKNLYFYRNIFLLFYRNIERETYTGHWKGYCIQKNYKYIFIDKYLYIKVNKNCWTSWLNGGPPKMNF